jgi:hypothetical protein
VPESVLGIKEVPSTGAIGIEGAIPVDWIVAGGMVLGALLMALGTAALRTGWTLPWARRHVTRPGMYGLGGVLMGLPVFVQGFFYFDIVPEPSWEVRFFGMNVLLLSGIALSGISQLGHRKPQR